MVFDARDCKYDLILGADFLSKTGIDIKYSTKNIEWIDNELPLRDPFVMFLKQKNTLITLVKSQTHGNIIYNYFKPSCRNYRILASL